MVYNNFVQIYNHIIEELVNVRVAGWLDKLIWMDPKGNPCSREEAHGCKVHPKVFRPKFHFLGDKVGGDISVKGDGYNGGERLVDKSGTISQQKTSTRYCKSKPKIQNL